MLGFRPTRRQVNSEGLPREVHAAEEGLGVTFEHAAELNTRLGGREVNLENSTG